MKIKCIAKPKACFCFCLFVCIFSSAELMMKLLSVESPDDNCSKEYEKYAAKVK